MGKCAVHCDRASRKGSPTSAPRVVLFAYACDPDQGSEPGAGWAAAVAAAGISESLVIVTRSTGAPRLEEAATALGTHVSVIRIDTPGATRFNTYSRYFRWVRDARACGVRLAQSHGVDVFHHVTYAGDWLPSPLTGLRASSRLIWGPVGGATFPPLRLAASGGVRDFFSEVLRFTVTQPFRAFVHWRHRRVVDVAIALNSDTATAMRGFKRTVIRSNAVLDYAVLPSGSRAPGSSRLVYAGRGVRWKGLGLVLESFDLLPEQWTLQIAGSGTDSVEYRNLAQRFGDRVTFHGVLPRQDTLDLVASASVFVLPSLHDSAPWAAAESSGMGVPVVCLTLGGVSEMAGTASAPVAPEPVSTLRQRLARAIEDADRVPTRVDRSFTLESYQAFLDGVYRA